ncbi:PAS domain-containing sensor histidine kinase [Mesorhizobium sp. Root552]|uniref:sensor histidine kinase n=1 Tax=Mesorhizobium sp. Root552 TaxID=1736555 RepID=UPI0006F477E3|nr:PAS domain-containing sensor histidine kinase [Mesorhizobium sp. Root552]
MAAGCERLVHGSVAERHARRSQCRFIGTMLCIPFLAAGAAVTLITASVGASVTLAVIFAVFGLYWLTALLVSATGRMNIVGGVALAVSALGLAVLLTSAGGLASPMAILAIALPVEAFWTMKSRQSAIDGSLAAFGAILLQLLPGGLVLPLAEPAAWQWLFPLAWFATLVPRLAGFHSEEGVGQDIPAQRELESAIAGVVFRMTPQGDVIDASDQSRSMMNLAPDLLLGTGLFDRIHLADRIAYLNALADMRDGAGLSIVDVRIRLPQENSGSLADNYCPFSMELMAVGENSHSFIALLRNNSKVEDLQKALARANESASSADVTKSRFLAAVSHELRTPLNAIIGFSDMLLHEMFGPFRDPRQKEYVGLVRDSGQHLLDVVTSILDVSRIEAGAYWTQMEPFRFADAVEMTRSMMQLQADSKGVRLDTRIAVDAGEINADRRAVQQILINLASNAIKFTPEGGEVMIGAQRVGSRLHFWVRDTGIGIAEDDLASLGQPFVQVQNDYTRRFEGTGLGLSLVKGLVTLHEGTMSIESMPGEGTTVSISVPVDGPKGEAEKLVVLPTATSTANKQGGSSGSLRKTA